MGGDGGGCGGGKALREPRGKRKGTGTAAERRSRDRGCT